MNDFLASVISESDRYLPVLRRWAEKGVYRTPLTNSLLINYPPITAASALTPADWAALEQALSSLPPDSGITLYVHIPFCSRKCTYCNYYSLPQSAVPDAYLKLLEQELGLWHGMLGSDSVTVRSLYIGGGTPSLLTEKQVADILRFIGKSFKLQPEAEITMEFHPEVINHRGTAGYLKTIFRLGVNRVSVGIQSLDDGILKATNRGHTRREAIAFLGLISKQGVPKLNFDIIYGGLPFQSLSSLYKTLTVLLAFKPTSITKHFCELKPGSADFARYRDNPALYPNWVENIRSQTLIDLLLGQYGYQKELLHMYTNAAFLFSHQQQKWHSPETVLLGLGPGTYGWVFHRQAARNLVLYKTFSLNDYRAGLAAGVIPVERAARLGRDETARRHIQYALNYGRLDKNYLQALIKGVSYKTSREINLIITKLTGNGFLADVGDRYQITPLGEYLSDELKALFASPAVLKRKPSADAHAAHHWYPGLDLVKRFKHIVLNDDAVSAG
jgi:oxygen-independent coproporphyrinogen-3 oxidase